MLENYANISKTDIAWVFKVDGVINYISSWIIENDKLLMSSIGCMILYIILSKEPLKQRILHGFCGFIAALIFSKPIAGFLSSESDAHIYAAGIALCGQFIPELLQTTIRKVVSANIVDKLIAFIGGKK